nr:transposase [Corynebacterium glutamicum]
MSCYRLVTSMIDPEEAAAKALVELYHQRWEVEVCYLELKSTLLDGWVLRGCYPQAVEQEVWAVLVLYQAIRIAMADSVLTVGISPVRLSFSVAIFVARDQVVLGFIGSTDRGVVGFVGRIGLRLLDQAMPKRRVRTRIRVVKERCRGIRREGGMWTGERTRPPWKLRS